jgi:hypothetical protein
MGNKSDLIKNDYDRKVTKDMVMNFMSENNNMIKYIECSAKDKKNLVEPFESLCKGEYFL